MIYLGSLLILIIISLISCFELADPGDRVEVDEPIAQIETDKVISRHIIVLRFISTNYD